MKRPPSSSTEDQTATDHGARRRMPGQDKLRREARRSPLLEEQFRTNLHTAIPAKEGAPRRLEDLPESVRKPLKPPAKKDES